MSRLCVVCSYPEREAELKLRAGATFGQLKADAAKALDIDLTDYGWSYVCFGEDVVRLDSKDDSSKVELKEGGTLFALAPAAILPKRERKQNVEAEAEVADRFKGFTPENIWKKLGQSKGDGKKLCLEYLDLFAFEVLKHKKFLSLPESAVLFVVKRETLGIPEIELFDAVLAWAKTQLKLKKIADTPEANQKILSSILPHIRFPVMSTEDVATKVATTGLLKQDQILDLFTYLAQRDVPGTKPGASLSIFKSMARHGGYGTPGKKIPNDCWSLISIVGQWSYGSYDNVNVSDRVSNSETKNIQEMINGQQLESWKRGDTYDFPRGGVTRCGIYTYPNSDPHALEFKFTRGPLLARAFRFFCTRLEGVVRLQCFAKKPTSGSFESSNLIRSGWTMPVLTNGGGQRQWIEINFDQPTLMDSLRIEIRGGQCAFHVVEFIKGP